MRTELLTLLTVAGTLVVAACGGAVDVELGRIGQGAGGSVGVLDGGMGDSEPIPDAGTGGDLTSARTADAATGSGGAAGTGGSAGGVAGGGGTGGSAPSLCDQILIDNLAPNPPAYPSIFQPPADALVNAQAQGAVFLTHYGLTPDQLRIQIDEVTATASFRTFMIDDPGVPLFEPAGKIDSSSFESMAIDFLLRWDGLFKSSGLTWAENHGTGCNHSGNCSLDLVQDYCGFGVTGSWPYSGSLSLNADQETGLIHSIDSRLVPMIPVYSKPIYTEEQVAASLVGETYSLCSEASCEAYHVTAETPLEFASTLRVAILRPDGANHLEYRLAYSVFVPYKLFEFVVDAIEGKVIAGIQWAIG